MLSFSLLRSPGAWVAVGSVVLLASTFVGARSRVVRGSLLVIPIGRGLLYAEPIYLQAERSPMPELRLVVLDACYSDAQATALRDHVDCIVGMSGAIDDASARRFAVGFYGGVGDGESVAAAFRQGCAAIHLEGLRDRDRPRLAVRDGVDATRLFLAANQRAGLPRSTPT